MVVRGLPQNWSGNYVAVGWICLSPNVSSYYWTGLQCLTLYIIDHAVIDALGRVTCLHPGNISRHLDGRWT